MSIKFQKKNLSFLDLEPNRIEPFVAKSSKKNESHGKENETQNTWKIQGKNEITTNERNDEKVTEGKSLVHPLGGYQNTWLAGRW